MGDQTRTVSVGFSQLITDTGQSHNTVRNARRELEGDGKLASKRGDGRGHVTFWTVLCLPEKGTSEVGTLSDEREKGTSEVGTLSDDGEARKGTNRGPERVPTEGQKGYQPKRADQREHDRGLDLIARPFSKELSEPANEGQNGDEKQPGTLSVIGDLGRGTPGRERKAADLNGDRCIPVAAGAVPPIAVTAAERELGKLSAKTGHPVPDGYAARVAAVILGSKTPNYPAAYVARVLNDEQRRYWPPEGTR
jgi:hypothetical protein